MSEFHVRVVKVTGVVKHPGADSLSIADIEGYPVVFRTGEFEEGQQAVYIPVDSIVPDTEQWAFLGPKERAPGDPIHERYRRIKAKKLRGVFSMGMLAPLPQDGWTQLVGHNMQKAMGITKWDPTAEIEHGTGPGLGNARKAWYDALPWYQKVLTRLFWARLYWTLRRRRVGYLSDNLEGPSAFQKYTDIESLRRHGRILDEGEQVVITEKIHGANARFGWLDGVFWVGSHEKWKRRPAKGEPAGWWWKAVLDEGLEERLKQAPDIGFYGEVYGPGVQAGFTYGHASLKVRFFDALDLKTGRYLDQDAFIDLACGLGLEVVPLLYRGPWSSDLRKLADGPSIIGGSNNIREGFVVKPVQERRSHIGRTILKLVGEQYLLLKGR